MPNRDKTGPNGDGPQTGRKEGNCVTEENRQDRSFGRGLGRGRGRGRGFGRGNGFGRK